MKSQLVGVGANVEGDQSAPAQTAPQQAGVALRLSVCFFSLENQERKKYFGDLILLLGVLGHFVLRILQYSEYFRVSYSDVRVILGSISGFYTPRYSGLEY